MRMFSVASSVTAWTVLSAPRPGLNVASIAPVVSSRAMRLRSPPVTVVNAPPITARPSACSAMASTAPFNPEPPV